MAISVYPKYMIVNKTSMPFIIEKQTFNPFTNDYFMPDANSKVVLQVPGFKKSNPIDINTVGLSGLISLDILDKGKEIKPEYFPH